ncbi:unnamed protein product [Urochloa humidicola]
MFDSFLFLLYRQSLMNHVLLNIPGLATIAADYKLAGRPWIFLESLKLWRVGAWTLAIRLGDDKMTLKSLKLWRVGARTLAQTDTLQREGIVGDLISYCPRLASSENDAFVSFTFVRGFFPFHGVCAMASTSIVFK